MRFDEATRGAFGKDMWPSYVELYLNLDKYERLESVREREIDIASDYINTAYNLLIY